MGTGVKGLKVKFHSREGGWNRDLGFQWSPGSQGTYTV